MTIHYAIVHYLQQWGNLKFDRCHLFYKEKKNLLLAFLWGTMKLNHCDISVRESAASLDLSFHLCINLPPVSASCYKKASFFQRCSLVSSVFCYSFWRHYLNGSGLALTIHSCLHIYQSILLSIFYLFLPFCTSRSPWFVATVVYHLIHHKCNAGMLLFLALCYMFALFCVPPPSRLSSSVSLCFTHLSSTWQNSYLSGDPSSNTFPTWAVHFILFFSSRESFAPRLFFYFFITNLSSFTSSSFS